MSTVANVGTLRTRTTRKSGKLRPDSSEVTPEQRAAMIALADVLREIFLRQQQWSLETKPDHRPTLTPKGKLLVQ